MADEDEEVAATSLVPKKTFASVACQTTPPRHHQTPRAAYSSSSESSLTADELPSERRPRRPRRRCPGCTPPPAWREAVEFVIGLAVLAYVVVWYMQTHDIALADLF